MGGESRGSIACFATYRPPVPLDIFSCPVPPSSTLDELHLTEGKSYNYNCRPIPAAALKVLLKHPKVMASLEGDANDADVSGFVFVSERDASLETLHISLRFNAKNKVKVLSLADIYGDTDFRGTRLEDSGCFGGGCKVGDSFVNHSLVYVSTKKAATRNRHPWTAVYRTDLTTGKTDRLTLDGTSDLSPAVSPSGMKVAVASFQGKFWNGEIENLLTDIYVMNVDGSGRKELFKRGGWPSWASDDVIFFHKKVAETWGVYRYTISTGITAPVTPDTIDAMTPAAISETKVAVATIRVKSMLGDAREEGQYRHIEIFDMAAPEQPSVQITRKLRLKADHYNPFVLDGGHRVGYHRCNIDILQNGADVPRNFHKMESPLPDVGLFRVSGVFPTISRDGSKLAFVDNEFKSLWVADSEGLRTVYVSKNVDCIFAPMWNQNPDKNIIYVCMGPSFSADQPLEIWAMSIATGGRVVRLDQLTKGGFNNAFPSSCPKGERLVFRSTKDWVKEKHKNLYIIENQEIGQNLRGKVTRLTEGAWTDTHCQWSPQGDWIVFASTCDKPKGKPAKDNNLDPGFFSVYLISASTRVKVRVLTSGTDLSGHVNHPVFSPDGMSISVTADLAGVSAEPISLPLFVHSVRPYGDIFVVDINPTDIKKNFNLKKFHRITHSRYEYSTPAWTLTGTDNLNRKWKVDVKLNKYSPGCPYIDSGGGESWHMTGHLFVGSLSDKRCC